MQIKICIYSKQDGNKYVNKKIKVIVNEISSRRILSQITIVVCVL